MKRVLVYITIFFSLISFFLYSEENFLVKKNNSFIFLTTSNNKISIQENSEKRVETFIDENLDKSSSLKNFRVINGELFLYIKEKSTIKIYKLSENRWKKVGEFSLENLKERISKSDKVGEFHTYKKFKNTITDGKTVYIIPEDFVSFYISKNTLYILNKEEGYFIVKSFSIKDSFPYPPLNVVQNWEHNYSLYTEEYLNEVKWSRNSLNSSVQYYNIYRKLKTEPYSKLKKIAHVGENVYFYWDRGLKVEDKGKYIYGVSVVDITLIESKISTTDGKFITPTEGPIYQWIFKIN